jgi:hypothetical protein
MAAVKKKPGTVSVSRKRAPARQHNPFNYVYAGKFEKAMNALFSSDNIKNTIAAIRVLEQKYEIPFEVGKFNRYLLADFEWDAGLGWDKFEADFFSIPADLRQRATDALTKNFQSPNPLPVVYKTSINVEPTPDVVVKQFTIQTTGYLGVLYLCPNPAFSPNPALTT